MLIGLLRKRLMGTRWLHSWWHHIYEPVIDTVALQYAVAFGFKVIEVNAVGVVMRGYAHPVSLVDGQPWADGRRIDGVVPWLNFWLLTPAPEPVHAAAEMATGKVYLKDESRK